MRCDEVLANLEEFHKGDIESSVRVDLERHLESCAICRQELDSLERETRLYAVYVQAMENRLPMRPELWDRIRSQIELNPATAAPSDSLNGLRRLWVGFGRFSGAQKAASIAGLAIALAFGVRPVLNLFLTPEPPNRTASPRPGDLSAPLQRTGNAQVESFQAVLSAIQQAERDYIQAIEMLSPTANKRKAMLDPKLQGAIERDMKIVDQNLTSLRKAYQARPQDVDLAKFMLSLYATKLELLQALTS